MSQSWLREGLEKVEAEIQKWPEWKKTTDSETIIVYHEKQELPVRTSFAAKRESSSDPQRT